MDFDFGCGVSISTLLNDLARAAAEYLLRCVTNWFSMLILGFIGNNILMQKLYYDYILSTLDI